MIRIFIFAFCLLQAKAGFTASPEEILKTAWKDQALQSYSEAVGLLGQAQPFNPFSEFQLTYEIGDLQKESQKYGFRVYPKGFSEFQAYRSFLSALDSDEKSLQSEALSQALVKRYQLIARLALLKAKNQSAKDLSNLTERADRALAYKAQKDRNQLKTYLHAKSDLRKIALELAGIDRDLKTTEQELKGLSLTGAQSMDLSDLVSPAEIGERISGFDEKKLSRSAERAQLAYNRSVSALSYDLAQENKWLNHLELSVKDDRREKFYSLEVGFKLPFLSAPDLGSLDKRARLARAKADSSLSAEMANQVLFASVAELRSLLTLYQILKEKQSQSDPTALKRASDMVAKQDPLLAVELQRGWFESFEQMAQIECQIRNLYIRYLHETSVLTREPETNHLSKTRKRIL